jgi:hypothetical protein
MSSKCQRLLRETALTHPGFAQHFERLVVAFGRLRDRNAEPGEFAFAIALADTEVDAAAGHQIEGGDLLGQQHGIVPGQHDHRGAEADPRGATGEIAQEIGD